MIKSQMTLAQARDYLETTQRWVLADYAFGDAEVDWLIKDKVVVVGCFGRESQVEIFETSEFAPTAFRNSEADSLRHLGQCVSFVRNDEQVY